MNDPLIKNELPSNLVIIIMLKIEKLLRLMIQH